MLRAIILIKCKKLKKEHFREKVNIIGETIDIKLSKWNIKLFGAGFERIQRFILQFLAVPHGHRIMT